MKCCTLDIMKEAIVSVSKKSSIAIVGMGLRLPSDVSTMERLWDVLINQENLISHVNHGRFAFDNYVHTRKTEPGKSYTFNAGVLSRIDTFDANFFGISPREACQIDPQQRLLLETTWEALEHGCQDIDLLAGKDCAVYIGIGSNEHIFQYINDPSLTDSYTMLGNCSSIAANRISYAFDFHGPSISVDTACSSSLVALHQACSSIWSGEASMALAGGVNLFQSPTSFIGFSKASMLSPVGKCKSFAAGGDGYVRSEGCIVLFLKPLEAAERDGDPIHAVIINSGVNSDGSKNSIIVPSAESQASLIAKVHEAAGIAVDDIQYLEAHGTGTAVGDKIEALAIAQSLAKQRQTDNPLLIGSIKSNVGHLEVVSGLTGMLKTILCLKNKIIPPSLYQEVPNPEINFNDYNLKVVDKASSWSPNNKPAIMAVNSFGFGGTNAHVIVAEYVSEKNHHENASSLENVPPLMLSLKHEERFPDLATQYFDFLQQNRDAYYDIAYTLSHRRTRHEKGMLLHGQNLTEILESLQSVSQNEGSPQVVMQDKIGSDLAVALVYSGNGAQYHGMGVQLIESEPIIRDTINEIDKLLAKYADFSIKDELMQSVDKNRLYLTEIAQPCLFALQVAMTRYLIQQGVRVSAVTGHSVGEIAAAWACGALTLKQAVQVIYQRSFWQGKTKGEGRMLVVALSKAEAEQLIAKHESASENCQNDLSQSVNIAVVNSERSVVLAGDVNKLEALQLVCQERGVFNRLLDLDYAFHSPAMDCMQKDLLDSLSSLKARNGAVRYVSTVTGKQVQGSQLNAAYWWDNIRQPVQFHAAITTLLESGIQLFIEVGPHAILKSYIDESILQHNKTATVFITGKKNNVDTQAALKNCVLRTWFSGGDFDATAAFFPKAGMPITLPAYLWSKESFRLAPSSESANQACLASEHPLLGRRIKKGEPVWEHHLDPLVVPYLADHMVNESTVMPAAAYAEMAIAASHCWYGNESHDIRDLEIIAPMVFEKTACRLVRFELNVNDGSFVIKSRLRTTEEEWSTHVLGRMIAEPAIITLPENRSIPQLQNQSKFSFSGEKLYAAAKSVGLIYGPYFQMIHQIWVTENEALAQVVFKRPITDCISTHHLYPGLLDGCFQLLVGMLCHDAESQQTFLPIRLGRLQLLTSLPEQIYLTACIVRKSKQSVLAQFSVLDKDGRVVALINDCRFKQAQFSEASHTMNGYVCRAHLLSSFEKQSGLSFALISRLFDQVKNALPRRNKVRENRFESLMPLLDLLIGYFIYDAIVDILGDRREFSLEDLITNSTGEFAQSALLEWCFTILVEDHYLQKMENGLYHVTPPNEPIDAYALWNLLLREYPDYITELLFIGRIGMNLLSILSGAMSLEELSYASNKNDALRHFIEDSPLRQGIHDLIDKTFSSICEQWSDQRRLRVLEVGYSNSALSNQLIQRCSPKKTDYYVLTTDEQEVQRNEVPFVHRVTQPIKNWFSDYDLWADQSFDVLIIRNSLHAVDDLSQTIKQIKKYLASDGVLLLAGQSSDRLQEFVLATAEQWWQSKSDTNAHSRLFSSQEMQQHLVDAGFQVTEPLFEAEGSIQEGHFLLMARLAEQESGSSDRNLRPSATTALILANAEQVIDQIKVFSPDQTVIPFLMKADALTEMNGLLEKQLRALADKPNRLEIVWVFEEGLDLGQSAGVCASIATLIHLIQGIDWSVYPKLTLVTIGAIPVVVNGAGTVHNPVHSTIWGMGRVLNNEYPDLSCKLIDIQEAFSPVIASNLAKELSVKDDEQEIVITTSMRYGLRVETLNTLPSEKKAHTDYCLDFKRSGSINNLCWIPVKQIPLAPDEVRIKPKATGLNFRDVMYTMGFVPDEALEKGFLGTTLGMEFAGEITALGESVNDFCVGDRVMGFAPAGFASVTTTKVHAIAHLPAHWSFSKGATVPIAYFTAYYSLCYLGRLKAKDRILIHGAAGGVGIAAIQIALHVGAKVYATAGSPEKRDFLKLMGVTHCYNSRSLLFADEILKDTQSEGIDLVLNCLAGEAINANLSVLKPFGRFLELGKRDFFANTKIGLRPFRNNISYFGIDADQLLMEDPALCSALFKEMMELFEQQILAPLPYREFSAYNITDSFRYMQQARHIGKIIVNLEAKPRENLFLEQSTKSLKLAATASYLVTGGFSGFGLQTARWLVDKGARHLVLVGRRGAVSEEACHAVEQFKKEGVAVVTYKVDISERQAVKNMLSELQQQGHHLRGIVHAAAIYEDALIHNLTQEKIEQVFAPKLHGAWNLHWETSNCALDFFIVYSSVATLFGNQGQANYVAANVGLEGLIANRRAKGLPGLSIAWGPIDDTGYLTRNDQVKDLLASKIGGNFLSSKHALQWLERLIQADVSGVTIAHLNMAKMKKAVYSFSSPKFALIASEYDAENELGLDEDVRVLIADKTKEEALAIIIRLLTSEISAILRLPMDKIDCKKPLFEIGMDSLVGAELVNAIQQRFSLQLSMLALSQNATIHSLAEKIHSQLCAHGTEEKKESALLVENEIQKVLHEASLHGEVLTEEAGLELLE